ncbi:DUF6311 domain-containing protein [Massilia sp. YIM B02763]|uniref:DUF6311 domain-containing protein n=1 Tax=Massilia sp. YIM B02763 TaxID=3050130 RepID=UPI0025B70142|nr:DUF6311 domain-containing protein [Massilia sp. YIM B02763]MDN4054649.1 DUF6311 domain-containing protein [Massilia sp. YIM B02763]
MNDMYRTGAPEARLDPRSLRAARTRLLDVRGALGLALAVLLALGYALWLYKAPMLSGKAAFWWRDHADITQYVTGFNAYVHEPWHWPLLRIESLNTPDGTLATFVDAIPLYAMLLKLVHPGHGYWNPFGLWIAICYVLQGVGAWWICREAKMRSWPVLAAMTLLLASFPALTFRIAHTSLMSQWMLLFALAIYLRGGRLGRIATGPWTALVVCGFYINIYLFAMFSAIFGADILRQLLRPQPTPALRRQSVARALAAPVAAYGLLFVTMWATMLPMPPGSGRQEWGFGFYSMNLLGPLHGGRLLELATPIAHEGQGEGFNYLGIFLLLLAAVVYKLRQRHDPAFWRRHGVLFGVLVLLTLFALSNTVYLGNVRLYSLHLPPQLDAVTSTFRSSGRFFWPVGYAIVVFAVLGAARYLKPASAALLLAAVVLLQFWDLQPHHARARETVSLPVQPAIDEARWDAFLGPGVKALHYYPPFGCGDPPTSEALLPTTAYAVKRRYPLSTGYIARTAKSCTGYAATISHLPASTAVVFDKPHFPRLEDAQREMGANATCADMQLVFLCRRNAATSPEPDHEKTSIASRSLL